MKPESALGCDCYQNNKENTAVVATFGGRLKKDQTD